MARRSGWAVAGVGLVCLFASACEPAPREDPPPKEEQAPQDPDRCAYRDPGQVFEAAFPGWSWTTLTQERRTAVSSALEGIVVAGPPAWVSLRRARETVLDAIRADEVFGAETIAIVVGESEGFEGEGLSLDQGEALVATARDRVSDELTRLRFRELKDEAARAKEAAASLGVSPSTEALAEFSRLFAAPMVLSLSAKVRFVPSGEDPEVVGHLQGRAQALVYHRGTGTVLARVQVRSPAPKPLRSGADLSGAADDVARELGDALAREVAGRLFERLYANQ